MHKKNHVQKGELLGGVVAVARMRVGIGGREDAQALIVAQRIGCRSRAAWQIC